MAFLKLGFMHLEISSGNKHSGPAKKVQHACNQRISSWFVSAGRTTVWTEFPSIPRGGPAVQMHPSVRAHTTSAHWISCRVNTNTLCLVSYGVMWESVKRAVSWLMYRERKVNKGCRKKEKEAVGLLKVPRVISWGVKEKKGIVVHWRNGCYLPSFRWYGGPIGPHFCSWRKLVTTKLRNKWRASLKDLRKSEHGVVLEGVNR